MISITALARAINAKVYAVIGLRLTSGSPLAEQFDSAESAIRFYQHFESMFHLIGAVEGDVVECGVANGTTFCYLLDLTMRENRGRCVWGFDSWEGLPEPAAVDYESGNPKAYKGNYLGSPKAVVQRTKAWGFTEEYTRTHMQLIKGWYSETLPTHLPATIALVHIDSDLYSSYVEVLKQSWPRLSAGGIIVLDEYHKPEWPGAKKAVDEFLERLPAGTASLEKREETGRYYLMKR